MCLTGTLAVSLAERYVESYCENKECWKDFIKVVLTPLYFVMGKRRLIFLTYQEACFALCNDLLLQSPCSN
jgi:hypothetical protein